jgi:hypothetical protein
MGFKEIGHVQIAARTAQRMDAADLLHSRLIRPLGTEDRKGGDDK